MICVSSCSASPPAAPTNYCESRQTHTAGDAAHPVATHAPVPRLCYLLAFACRCRHCNTVCELFLQPGLLRFSRRQLLVQRHIVVVRQLPYVRRLPCWLLLRRRHVWTVNDHLSSGNVRVHHRADVVRMQWLVHGGLLLPRWIDVVDGEPVRWRRPAVLPRWQQLAVDVPCRLLHDADHRTRHTAHWHRGVPAQPPVLKRAHHARRRL